MVEAYLRFVALEVRELLSRLGLRTLDEAVGRTDLLRQRRTGDSSADALDLGPLLGRAGQGPARYVGEPVPHEGDRLGALLAAQGRAAISGARLVEPAYAITNGDRAIGARLSGAVARSVGSGPPAGRVRARFEGAAGQSFGAFLAQGIELRLVGEANDYVGQVDVRRAHRRLAARGRRGRAGPAREHRPLRSDRRRALLRGRSGRALRGAELGRDRGRRGSRRSRLRVHDARHGRRARADTAGTSAPG